MLSLVSYRIPSENQHIVAWAINKGEISLCSGLSLIYEPHPNSDVTYARRFIAFHSKSFLPSVGLGRDLAQFYAIASIIIF